MYTLRIGGTWAQQLAPVGDIKYSWGEHGPLAASWGMALPVGFLHPALVQGATVEIFYGGLRVWRGVLEEPDRDEWTCTARGTAEALTDVANLSNVVGDPPVLGNSTYDGAVRAIERGFDLSADGGLPGGPWGPVDPTPVPEYGLFLRGQLDAFTAATGTRWAVDEHGLLHLPEEPTTPTWALTPTVPGVGVTLDNYYSATYMQYTHAVDPFIRTVASYSPHAWRWGPRERTLVHDPEVTLSDFAAKLIVDLLQAESVAAPTVGVTLTDGQLITLGGTRVPLQMLRTGVMVRHYGVLDVPGARNVHEWIINHFEMDTTARTATVTPRHIAPRTLAQIVQSISGAPDPRFVSDSDSDAA